MRNPHRLLRRLHDDRSGASTVVVGLTAVVLLGSAGLATDVAGWYAARRDAQHAADSAAYSAAVALAAGSSDVQAEGRAIAAAYGLEDGHDGATVTVARLDGPDGPQVEVVIERPARRVFSQVLPRASRRIRARAVAQVGADGGEGCVLALHPSEQDAVELSGSADVRLNGCSMRVNSDNASALKITGSSRISAPHVLLGGAGWSRSGSARMSTEDGDQPLLNQQAAADPYADVPEFDDFHGCDYRRENVGGSETASYDARLGPKIFCEGLTINGSARVTFKPGVYVINRGELSASGSSTITAERGATFILTSSTGSDYARLKVTGSAKLTMTAPETGPYAGLAIYQSREAPQSRNAADNTFTGSSDSAVTGAIYLPRQSLDYHGSAAQTSGCVQVIASTLKFTGSAGLALNCAGVGVRPIGGGGGARLIR